MATLVVTILLLTAPAWAQPSTDRREFSPCAERGHSIGDGDLRIEATKQAAVLTSWIVAQAHWAKPDLPLIRIIPRSKTQKMFNAEVSGDIKCEALYSNKDDTVYLSDNWRTNDLRDRSIVLHELVHHLQYLNHVKAGCESRLEFQAFKLRAQWLSKQGVE
ncbi:MAG: hypothetical protein P8Z80_07065 [Pseudolabrys sp.]